MKKLIGVSVVVALWAAGVAACGGGSGDSTYTKADLIEDLEGELGMTEELATCIADAIESSGVDLQQLAGKVDADLDIEEALSEQDLATLTEVSALCVEPANS